MYVSNVNSVAVQVRIMEMDFLDVARELLQDPSMLDSFQFYLFDGPHAMADQYGTPQQAHSFQIRR